jgi:hypothetical protein
MSKQTHFARQLSRAKHRAAVDQHARALRALLVTHPAVKDAFQALPAAARAEAWLIRAEYDASVSIGAALRDLPSFKAPVLERTLAPFLSPEWGASTQDFAYDQPNRDYRFMRIIRLDPDSTLARTIARHPSARWLETHGASHHIPTRLVLTVAIYAYVKADSPTCRVVVTGVTERVVREEVKEIVCA